MNNKSKLIGFSCAYTPLAIIEAAGYVPFRVLPVGEPPDQAGSLLHDNLCPHVKRILDRAFAGELPELAGMVFINSCDAMRRLADAWEKVRPNEPVIRMDLPTTVNDASVSYFAGEIIDFANTLSNISGQTVEQEQIRAAVARYAELSAILENLKSRINSGAIHGGSSRIQELYNRASTEAVVPLLKELNRIADEPQAAASAGVPIFLFGNVLPDPESFSLFESCGASIVENDLCTGSRLFGFAAQNIDKNIDELMDETKDIFVQLAGRILSQEPCARTFDPDHPGKMANDLLSKAMACGARAAIGHSLKFCDPYLTRLPAVRDVFQNAGFPLLLLEGDCTLRSIGQHRTRIEAFIEMIR
jgi:benzoyl-CoA reductase/2-hydroxyglutaryl-CoA dehydratase subunit BcrC/BadD/HgdB